jgi:hypothetical protein
LIEEGPGALQASEHFALLWDAESLRWLHHEFRSRLEEIVQRIGLSC